MRIVTADAVATVRILLQLDDKLEGLRVTDAALEDAIAQLVSDEERMAA